MYDLRLSLFFFSFLVFVIYAAAKSGKKQLFFSRFCQSKSTIKSKTKQNKNQQKQNKTKQKPSYITFVLKPIRFSEVFLSIGYRF